MKRGVAQQTSAQKNLTIPEQEKCCCRGRRQQHVASPSQFLPHDSRDIGMHDQPLVTLQITAGRLRWISTGPQCSDQHQSDGSETGQNLSPLQLR